MNFERYLFLIDADFSKFNIVIVLHGLLVNLIFLIGPVLYLVHVNLGKS